MHLDDERLERLVHGELAPDDAATARVHLLECAECRARMAAAEREERQVFALIGAIDHPVPAVPFQRVLDRAGSPSRAWYRWAAAAALVVGLGGVAYALPGSPLRRWVEAAVERVTGAPDGMIPDPVRIDPPLEEHAGIAVSPGESLVIDFTGPEEGGSARVVLTDSTEVVISAPAGAATFRAEADQVIILRTGIRARFDIEIPASAPRVEVRAGARRVFLKHGPEVTADVGRRQDGAWLLMLGANGK
ncbi:MAG: anti-sigma factor family protein [Gemmatimonadales bacterium]